MYPDLRLFIGGSWVPSASGATLPVLNPATEEEIGTVAKAGPADLDNALAAAARAFKTWKEIAAFERGKILRKAAQNLRDRVEAIAPLTTMEQGKPLSESRFECNLSADVIDWFAEEGRRAYGRLIPARAGNVHQLVIREPVGVVAGFSPWNFPINQATRKISAALATGCTIILKGPEEAPASCVKLVECFADAGLPAGVINLVFGVPAEISEYLIAHPVVRKISFTGSTAVGKHLAALAGRYMKRTTMELGGHAPVIVCDDADLGTASKLMAGLKYRNAGQVCVSPTRFLVHEKVFDEFVSSFVAQAKAVKVGSGLAADTTMGPLAHERRIIAMMDLVADARQHGAKVCAGGDRIGNKGYFFQPTVLTNVPREARIMNEEPFGPIALMMPYHSVDEAVAEANRLPYGLASYAFTRSEKLVSRFSAEIEAGMLTINHLGLSLPEVPFGGMKDSGYGSEGGAEALDAYLNSKFVTHMSL